MVEVFAIMLDLRCVLNMVRFISLSKAVVQTVVRNHGQCG